MPMPGMAVYAASKAFVLRFTEALAYELRETPLTVLALVPGPPRTDFYRASGSSEKGMAFQDPDEVVSTALSALDKKTPLRSVVSGARNRWTSRIATRLPRPPRPLPRAPRHGRPPLPTAAHDTLPLGLVAGFTRRAGARPSPRPGRSARR